jgi:hypothetical protein
MSNIAGEIYFIAEEPSVSAPPVRVKIGLVRESKNRDSHDRRSDHQTGNPRRLVLLEAIQTARVSKVENSLHQRFAGRRGIGEWFELSEAELSSAIEKCRELAAQQAVHLPVIRQAERMRGAQRNDVMISATEEINEWHRAHQVAKASESVFNALKKSYSDLIKTAHGASADINEYAVVSEVHTSLSTWLKENHPTEHEASKKESRSVKFLPKPLKVDASLESNEAELCKELEVKLAEWTVGGDFSSLHGLYLETLRPKQIWKEERELATAYLKVFCGQARGIDSVCEWKPSSSRTFSKGIAEEQYPQLIELFAMYDGPSSMRITLRGGDESEDSED